MNFSIKNQIKKGESKLKRRGLCYFVNLVLICLLLAGCGKEKEMEFERDYSDYSRYDFKTVQREGLQAFAVKEDGGIILSTQDKKLISYDSSGKLLKEENADSVYRFLCYSGEKLYGYDYSQSVIVDLTEATPRIVENSLSFRTVYNRVVACLESKILGLRMGWLALI